MKDARIKFSPIVAGVRASLTRGDDTGALKLLENGSDDDFCHGQMLRGRFYSQRAQPAKALLAFEAALSRPASDPMRSRAYCENIDLLYRLKSFDAALECAQNALGLFPDQEGIALRAARSHIQAGDTDRGIALISRTFKLGMVDADSHRIVIDICRILNKTDPDSALHVMNAAGPNISENLSAFKLLGEAHAKKKAFKEAAANFMIYFRKTKDEKEKKKFGIVLMELESKHKVLEIEDIHEIDNYQATINHPAIGRTFRIAAITNVYN